MIQYTLCEQNDPCSGCYPKSFQEHLAFAFSSVSMAATEERLVFLEVGTWANSALADSPLKYCGVYVRCIPV